MTYFTIAMVGRAPEVVEAATLGDAVRSLGIDAEQATFRANGETVNLDFESDDPVTVMGAKNLVGA